MALPIEATYNCLLQPVKDAEKSFQIDVAQLLYSYVKRFVQGEVAANFNSAALLLQGSTTIYGRKVDYLFDISKVLYRNLSKPEKEEHVKKDKTTKDKNKESRFSDPFFSTDIKIGKNLSCLKRKNVQKASKANNKKPKAKKCLFVPVALLPFEGEEKGDVFYDTKGEAIGNKADFTLTKCRITSTGWLLLPTISIDQIPTENSPPDYSFHCNYLSDINLDEDTCHDADMPCATPDEGIDMGSQSEVGSQVPGSQDTPEIPLSQQTDEGLGSLQSTPQDMLSQPSSQPMEGVESPVDADEIPINDVLSEMDVNSTSTRRSMRVQAAQERMQEKENKNSSREEEVAVKKCIQKKNITALPAKLKAKESAKKQFISLYCARTFFQLDSKFIKNQLMSLETVAFQQNSAMLKRLQERCDQIRAAARKTKKVAEHDEEGEVDIETISEPDPDDVAAPNDVADDDIVINDDIPLPDNNDPGSEEQPSQLPNGDVPPTCSEEPIEDDLYIRDMKSLNRNAEIQSRVRAFEKRLNPFLDELETREAFDINQYGSRILNSFDSSEGNKVRKQTKTFKDFCKGMKQWEIHRYFMALLPLANIGNVSLESEVGPDGEEQILITLLSKKMHHLRLEEFGNGDSSNNH